ncbi:hypothetical protein IMZ48_44365 [Candidatus Bathyarchaeota archaeon]|nr:hypothetical protein [Candidatus Bathyarchaeota archaeon]
MLRAKPIKDDGWDVKPPGLGRRKSGAGASSGGVEMRPVSLPLSATSQILSAEKCFFLGAAG